MRFYCIMILGLVPLFLFGQKLHFDIELEPLEIEGVGGLQSYAYGQYDDHWVFIGGRLDGLHQRQPFASFNESGNNTSIFVVDPNQKKSWKTNISDLPLGVFDQLQSTNMQFHQEGQYLILTGGYGYSVAKEDHTTYPFLTVIDLIDLIKHIKNGESVLNDFVQVEDEKFAVAGGRLDRINEVFYLVGGHLFEGRYNPHGPDHGPGFMQEYTNEIRPFTLEIEWPELSYEHLPVSHDEMHLRRRDYNLVPIIKEGKEALMIYSGVFQQNSDLPWLYPVLIEEEGHTAIEEFNQYFNHYHCPTISLYSETLDENHTLFFGGIAQFYIEDDMKVQDNDVPFVKTIADVHFNQNMVLNEEVLSFEMPDFLGAGAEFLINPQIDTYNNGVINLDNIGDQKVEVGTVFGGIKSDDKNIFWTNTGTESIASSVFYKVKLSKSETNQIKPLNKNFDILVFPNPTDQKIRIAVDLHMAANVTCNIFNQNGKLLKQTRFLKEETTSGMNYFEIKDLDSLQSSFILVQLEILGQTISRKVIVDE